jgi:hypothetical protein
MTDPIEIVKRSLSRNRRSENDQQLQTNRGSLSLEVLVSLSSDEFARLVTDYRGTKPNDLLMMITRFEQDVLLKIKTKDGEGHERYQFYNRILRIMYMALQAEDNINF